MALGQIHLTPKGPKPCTANPSKPGGRACRYTANGHFEKMSEAEEAFASQVGGTIPTATRKIATKIRPSRKVQSNPLIRIPESDYNLEDMTALRDYRNGANWDINRSLRKGSMPPGRAGEAAVRIDNLIQNSSPLTSAVTLQRSLETGKGSTVSIPSVGEVYSDPAFLSCSSNSEYIENTLEKGVDEYADYPSDTILSIEVPRGAKVLALSLEDSDYEIEAEVLLPRNSKLEITGDSGFINGVRRVQARLIAA